MFPRRSATDSALTARAVGTLGEISTASWSLVDFVSIDGGDSNPIKGSMYFDGLIFLLHVSGLTESLAKSVFYFHFLSRPFLNHHQQFLLPCLLLLTI